MSGTRRLVVALAAALCLAAAAPAANAAVYPDSIAATGDSITRAFNTCAFPFIDCPANSWATGTNATVNSFYTRLLALNPGISGNLDNRARSGAQMDDLPGQVTNVVSDGAEFVTVEMGANDVCTGSVETMTSVASFRTSFEDAMDTLTERLPGVRIAVGSIPNVYHLWRLLNGNGSAVSTWNTFRICQSLLRNPTSRTPEDEERRLQVQTRNVELNEVLGAVCAEYADCQYDGGAGYEYAFEAGEVSTRDYFHPSVAGQRTIAAIEWPLVEF
jgi:lysophospholipase L1-like esterase